MNTDARNTRGGKRPTKRYKKMFEHLVYRRAGEVDYVNVRMAIISHHCPATTKNHKRGVEPTVDRQLDAGVLARKVETLPRSPPPRPRPAPLLPSLGERVPSTPQRRSAIWGLRYNAGQCGTIALGRLSKASDSRNPSQDHPGPGAGAATNTSTVCLAHLGDCRKERGRDHRREKPQERIQSEESHP